MNYEFNVKLVSPDGDETIELNPVAKFDYDPNTYGNGFYMVLKGADLGFNNLFDCRYDKRLKKDNLAAYAKSVMNDIWTGKNGAWSIVEINER